MQREDQTDHGNGPGTNSSESAVNHLSKSVVRENRTPRSVGTGGGQLPPATRCSVPMPRRATRILPNGRWTETSASATVTLAFDDRYRRRIQLTDDAGVPFLLDLARPAVLADGDGLLLDDGGIIAVRAAAEDLAEV